MDEVIAHSDFMCFVCCTMSFEGEEAYIVDHTIHGSINLCALCGAGAERLGWIIR